MLTKNNNLLFIGPIPEPKGGVSVHIIRLTKLLDNEFNIKYIDESSNQKANIYNIRSLNVIKYIRLILWADIVHIHSGVTLFRTLNISLSKILKRKTIVTIHSLSHQTPISVKFNSIFLKLADKVILVSKELQKSLKIRNAIIKEAFIPPIMENEPELPMHVDKWIKWQKNNKRIIISANASKITLHNNSDLYGFDLCIAALDHLIHKYKVNVCLVLVVAPENHATDILQSYYSLIKEFNLEEFILLTIEDLSFVNIIDMSDIVLRPTNTDGDSLTIREAIFLQKTIIASDVVQRPLGTITFRNRDIKDLCLQIYKAMPLTLDHNHACNSDYTKRYLDFYKNIYDADSSPK